MGDGVCQQKDFGCPWPMTGLAIGSRPENSFDALLPPLLLLLLLVPLPCTEGRTGYKGRLSGLAVRYTVGRDTPYTAPHHPTPLRLLGGIYTPWTKHASALVGRK